MVHPISKAAGVVAIAALVFACVSSQTLRPGQACGSPVTAQGPCPQTLACSRQRGGPCGQYEEMRICTKLCQTDADCAGYDTRWGERAWTCKPRCAGSSEKICDWAER
ncbi:MAG: hypothetical protein U0235_20170 [Polyangiaceae bacterium]